MGSRLPSRAGDREVCVYLSLLFDTDKTEQRKSTYPFLPIALSLPVSLYSIQVNSKLTEKEKLDGLCLLFLVVFTFCFLFVSGICCVGWRISITLYCHYFFFNIPPPLWIMLWCPTDSRTCHKWRGKQNKEKNQFGPVGLLQHLLFAFLHIYMANNIVDITWQTIRIALHGVRTLPRTEVKVFFSMGLCWTSEIHCCHSGLYCACRHVSLTTLGLDLTAWFWAYVIPDTIIIQTPLRLSLWT